MLCLVHLFMYQQRVQWTSYTFFHILSGLDENSHLCRWIWKINDDANETFASFLRSHLQMNYTHMKCFFFHKYICISVKNKWKRKLQCNFFSDLFLLFRVCLSFGSGQIKRKRLNFNTKKKSKRKKKKKNKGKLNCKIEFYSSIIGVSNK